MSALPHPPFDAWLHLDGWAGRTRAAVVVISESSKRYTIKNPGDEPIKIAGRCRWLLGFRTALVPKYAITLRSGGQTCQAER